MFPAEHDKVLQTLVLQCLNEPLDIGHRIRRAKGGFYDIDLRLREDFVERGREFGVAVMHDRLRIEVQIFK